MFSLAKGDSRELLTAAVILSLIFAQGQGQEEMGKLAAFFTLMGDILALLALQPGLFEGLCPDTTCPPENPAHSDT